MLLLSFLPGFAPILAYIAIDAFLGETAGLIAGVALGVGEFLFILFREKRLDAFTLVDTVLLVAMGAVSWILSDPVYFRLKPAISGGVLALMMIAGSLGPHRFFLPYMEKKMGMGELPEFAARRMLAMIAGFGFLTLAHSALTTIAALWWSRAAWNFVAGALFWILAAAYMAAWMIPSMIARIRSKVSNAAAMGVAARAGEKFSVAAGSHDDELLPVVDAEGRIVGKASRSACHAGSRGAGSGNVLSSVKLLHPVVRLWLTDGAGNYWLQKRSLTKLVSPGKWDSAVGGHIAFGETVESALRREAREEIGLLDPGALSLIEKYTWETASERELVFTFLATLPSSAVFNPDHDEVDEIRLWSSAEIESARGKHSGDHLLTPLTLHELERFMLP